MDIINNIIEDVYLTKRNYKEMLKGAYIILDDDGKLYKRWSKKRNIKHRYSSHYSNDKQYEKKLNPKMKCSAVILFGTTNKNHTWFQLEKTSKDCILQHTIDYIDYITSNKNIGIKGKSKYTEKKPLKLKYSNNK